MADVTKFGVPLGGQKLGMLHPKQQHKFRVVLFNFGFGADTQVLTQEVKNATRPTLSHSTPEVHSYNTRAYIAGKHEWETVDFTFYDDITNGVVSSIGSQVQRQMNHFEQTSAVAGVNYKFSAEVHTLDGTNAGELESWRLVGCFISNVDYPEGDYEADEANTVTMTIRYDEACHLQGSNTNGGTTVSGNPFPNIPSPGGGTTIA